MGITAALVVLRCICYLVLAFFLSWMAHENKSRRLVFQALGGVFVFVAFTSLSALGRWFSFDTARFILTPFVVVAAFLAIAQIYKGRMTR